MKRRDLNEGTDGAADKPQYSSTGGSGRGGADGASRRRNAARGLHPRLWCALAVVAVLGVAALVAGVPRGAQAPAESDSPRQTARAEDASAASGGQEVRLDADATLTRAITYTRCPHEIVTRSVLPPELVGKTRADVEALYEPYRVAEIAADAVRVERQADLFCPRHYVLLPDAAGMLCVFQNKYGDALALVSETQMPLDSLPAAEAEEARDGKGFDTLEALEQWLESAES